MIIRPILSCIYWLEFAYRMNDVTSFYCDLILNVHNDITTFAVTSFWMYILTSSLLK